VNQAAGCSWEALAGDPLPWLLDEQRPNLLWRALVELVGRPAESVAVGRARGGANAAEPVASLLAELDPDGSWSSERPTWSRYAGPGWRLVAAVGWGADPGDPRLHAAGERLLASAPGEGGFAPRAGVPPSPLLTARLVQAVIDLGFGRHLRVQEALAWMGEEPAAWSGDRRRQAVAGVALSAALAGRPELGRQPLRDRAAAAVVDALADCGGPALDRPGHPNLERTDLVEMLWSLARAGVPFERRLAEPMARLQRLQVAGGRWRRRVPRPPSLPISIDSRSRVGAECRWVTLHAVVAINVYAVAARLPRRYPSPPAAEGGDGQRSENGAAESDKNLDILPRDVEP
jgi:hypothetical protein